MMNPNSPLVNKPSTRLPIALAVLHFIFTIILITVGIRVEVPQMLLTAAITGLIAIAAMICYILLRRGQNIIGSWLLIVAIAVGVPLVTTITEGFGWVSLFTISIVIILISVNNLPAAHNIWAILLSVSSGTITLFIELFSPPGRQEFPNANIITPVIAALVALIFINIIGRRFANYTLRVKLLVFFLVVALLPIGILTWINNRNSVETLTQVANLNLSSTAAITANQIDGFLQLTLRNLEANTRLSTIQSALTESDSPEMHEQIVDLLRFLLLYDPSIRNYMSSSAILDETGQVIANYPDDTTTLTIYQNLPEILLEGIQSIQQTGKLFISPVIFDQSNNAKLYFVAPIYANQIIPQGYIIWEYHASILQYLLESSNGQAGTASYGVIFDENNIYIAHGTAPENNYKTVAALPTAEVQNLIAAHRLPDLPIDSLDTGLPDLDAKLNNTADESVFTAEEITTGGRTNQVAVVDIETQTWQLAFFQPQDIFLAPIEQQNRTTFLVVLVIVGAVALLSVGATRIIATPITNLTELVERIATGELTITVPITTQDEIGRLSSVFNTLTTQTRNLLSGLEAQIIRRTQELERQTNQLQTAAEVARDASSIQNMETLIAHAADLISDRFGFYHTGIFLLDSEGEYAVLKAASSEGGRKLIENGHQLRVGEVGIVGTTTGQGAPHIALDVDIDAAHFVNPYLPDTRSEMALPLKIGDRVIGALDVQSKERGAFDQSDVEVLQIMADQLAIAIENTRLLTEVQSTVLELQTAYGEYTTESWLEWLQGGDRSRGYRYRSSGVEVLKGDDHSQSAGSGTNVFTVPLEIRGETFGEVQIQVEGDSVPQELSELITTVVDRLALTLDSARLFEDVQRRATQEQITGEISSRIRESLDIDSVVRTATQEIGERLGLHKLSIHLDMNAETPPER